MYVSRLLKTWSYIQIQQVTHTKEYSISATFKKKITDTQSKREPTPNSFKMA